jgi:hypothetical protein
MFIPPSHESEPDPDGPEPPPDPNFEVVVRHQIFEARALALDAAARVHQRHGPAAHTPEHVLNSAQRYFDWLIAPEDAR